MNIHKRNSIQSRKEVAWCYIHQLDNTQELAGCIYSNDLTNHRKQLSCLLDYEFKTERHSYKTCIQLVKHHHEGFGTGLIEKDRLKLYTKAPFHLLQTSSLTKKISMGLTPLLMSSHTFYQDLMASSKDCMSRSEKCELFSSVEEEETFLLK